MAAGFIGLSHRLPLVGIHRPLACGVDCLRLAALGAAIGEAGLAGPQLELLLTHHTYLDREGHCYLKHSSDGEPPLFLEYPVNPRVKAAEASHHPLRKPFVPKPAGLYELILNRFPRQTTRFFRDAAHVPKWHLKCKVCWSMHKNDSPSQVRRLNDGLAHHRSGALALAEACYLQVLQHDASHPDALNLLGVLARGRGELDRSEGLIRCAIARSPDVATYHHSLGRSYAMREQRQAAMQCFRTAIALNPADTDSMQVLGSLLAAEGERAEAIAWYRKALARSPDRVDTQIGLIELLKSTGDACGALAQARVAADQVPHHFDLQYVLASLLIEAGLQKEALAPLHQAIQLKPEEYNPYHCLGTLLHELGHIAEARAAYSHALRLKPDFVDSLSNLGALLKECGEFRSGEILLRKAIELDPTFLNARCNLGCLLEKQGDSLAAVECFRAVLMQDQHHVPTLCNLGLTLDNLGDEEGARTCYRLAIEHEPKHPLCRFNLSLHHLADAEFEAGWREYEHRWRTPPFLGKRTALTQKQWNGEPLQGSSIFVYAEQGLGDTIQFYRYVPMLAERGAEVVFEVQPEVFELLRDLHPGVKVIRKGESIPRDAEWHCPLLSLPGAFGTDLQSIPGHTPYLTRRNSQALGTARRASRRPGVERQSAALAGFGAVACVDKPGGCAPSFAGNVLFPAEGIAQQTTGTDAAGTPPHRTLAFTSRTSPTPRSSSMNSIL